MKSQRAGELLVSLMSGDTSIMSNIDRDELGEHGLIDVVSPEDYSVLEVTANRAAILTTKLSYEQGTLSIAENSAKFIDSQLASWLNRIVFSKVQKIRLKGELEAEQSRIRRSKVIIRKLEASLEATEEARAELALLHQHGDAYCAVTQLGKEVLRTLAGGPHNLRDLELEDLLRG